VTSARAAAGAAPRRIRDPAGGEDGQPDELEQRFVRQPAVRPLWARLDRKPLGSKGAIRDVPAGQVFELNTPGADGSPLWAYRYRVGGRGARRVQRGGFATERDARDALERALEALRREQGMARSLTFAELVEEYLAQHEVDPATIEKLRWLLGKAVAAFGDLRVSQLRAQEIAAWRMTVPAGHRFEATQTLRQVLARAVEWGMIDVNAAKHGVDNPQRRRTEKRPFESWAQLDAVAAELGPRHGPMVLFAAATGLRPSEWMALEHRDIDRDARVVYVRRAFRNGRLKCTKTEGSVRAVPLQAMALTALEQLQLNRETAILFPSPRGGYFDLHNFRTRDWKPAQLAAGITPLRRVYDLRHTFATFALCAGISTFDLSRYMGARLTRSTATTAISPATDATTRSNSSTPSQAQTRPPSTPWTLRGRCNHQPSPSRKTESSPEQEETGSSLTDSNRRPPPYHGGSGASRAYTRDHSRHVFSCKSGC
jgi:integrase